jgi:peroxiredoxin Q/BCP
MAVNVGDKAPDFTLPGVAGGERRDYTLSEYAGRKVVLAFYPGDFTPGCTKQMCQYRDQFEEFRGVDAVLLGISPQDVDSHERFAAEKGFTFPLLADTDKAVAGSYGIVGPGGVYRRSVFVLDEQGVVRWRNVKLVGFTWKTAGALDGVLQHL